MADQICIYNPWTTERDPVGGFMRDWKKAEEKAVELSKAHPEWIVIVESGGRYDDNRHGYLNGVKLTNPRYKSGPTELSTECSAHDKCAKDGETFSLPRYFVEQHNGSAWIPRLASRFATEVPKVFVTEFAARQFIRKETGYRHTSYRQMRIVLDGKPVLYADSGNILEGDPAEIGARIDAQMQAQREREAARQAKANAALVQKDELYRERIMSNWTNSVSVRKLEQDDFVALSDDEITAKLATSARELRDLIGWLENLALERPGHDALTSALCNASEEANALVKALTEGEAIP